MAWEIDRFGQKPSGFLASWRYVRVMVDINGNITNEPVPGEEYPNLNCLSDYKKNDRNYGEGQLITTFCNTTTFTNYRIYATNCKPYAYTQVDLNAPQCGYQVPLPEPYVPPTPFGTASYGFYAYLDVCDNKNIPINIRIYRRNYTGSPIKINNGGASPAVISYKNSDENKLSPIRACEFQLTMVADGSFNLEQFYTKDEREFKVQVLKGGVTKFMGFGTPAEASEDFSATPYDITWRATDGLGALKQIDYPIPIGAKTDIKQKFIEIICYCLAMTNLDLDIATICNLYEISMLNGIDDDPLAQASVKPLHASEKGKIFNCYKLLEKICLQFGAFLVQDNGVWHFVRQSELANSVLRKRVYNYKGFFIRSEQFHNKRVATCNGDDITILDDSPTLRIGNAYKRSEVRLDFGTNQFLLYNGDFEIFNGNNFAGWTKYGGLQISRVENQIKTTTGNIPAGNYSIQFDELADNSKYFEAAPISVSAGDEITMSFDIGSLNPNGYAIAMKFRLKIDNYHLGNGTPSSQNGYNNVNLIWFNQLTTAQTISYIIPPIIGQMNKTEIAIPAIPVSGNLILELFGFIQVQGIYSPVLVDNFVLSKSAKDESAGQVLYASQQDGFYTSKPDEIDLLFGDYTEIHLSDLTGLGGFPSTTIKNDQYAIYIQKTFFLGLKFWTYSAGWYEYGGSTSPIPIGLALARSILKAYQQPFRFLESSFLGDNISYLDIFNVNLPGNTDFNNRIFSLLSGDFDLISGEVKNANYAEIFNKPGKSVDIILPGKSGDPFPPITQNPNPAPETTSKIFTHEFTNEFK